MKKWLEKMIEGCDDLGGMEREKAIYQNCLKKARNLELATVLCKHCDNSDIAKCDSQYTDIDGDYDDCTVTYCKNCLQTHSINV